MKNKRDLTALLLLVSLFSCVEPYDMGSDRTEYPQEDFSTNEANLLENGGLEEWNMFPYHYDMPTGWYCHNNTNVKKNENIKDEGVYSARMSAIEKGITARIDQIVPVCPGEKVRIQFKYYIEQWKAKGARTYCYFRTEAAEKYNISKHELEEFYNEGDFCVIRGGGYGLTYFPHELNTWMIFDETIEVPPTAKYFVFGINSYYGTTIYIDDCCVTSLATNL